MLKDIHCMCYIALKVKLHLAQLVMDKSSKIVGIFNACLWQRELELGKVRWHCSSIKVIKMNHLY